MRGAGRSSRVALPRGSSRRRARCGSGPRRSWRAAPFTWLSTVRVPEAPGQPHTSAQQPLAGHHGRRARRPGRPAGRTRSGSAGPRLVPPDPTRGRVDPQAAELGRPAAGQLGRAVDPSQQGARPGPPAPASGTAWSGSRRRRRPSPTRMSASSSRAVSISTGTGRSAWIRRHTSCPSKPGSITSSSTRSGASLGERRRRAAGRRTPGPRRTPRTPGGRRPPG